MKNLSRLFLICFVTMFGSSAVLQAQTPDTTNAVVSGKMDFQTSVPLFLAMRDQGLKWSYGSYSFANPNGFEVIGGTLDTVTGVGEVLCDGDMYFHHGSLTMDLRAWAFENVGPTPYITAAVYQNDVYMGRQTIFTVFSGSAFGPISTRSVSTSNSYLSFAPAFAGSFINFFQMPQLAPYFSPNTTPGTTGLVSFSILVAPQPKNKN